MIVTEKKTPVTSGPMNKAEATAITKRIRNHIDAAWADITTAYERKAWKPLGYATWEAYVRAEFDISRRHSYRLIDQGRVIREIAEATGQNVTRVSQISARDVEAVKDDLDAVKSEIKSKIDAGEKPDAAAADAVAARRAEKDRQREARQVEQEKNDQFHEQQAGALPQVVKDHQQATEQWKARSRTGQAAETSEERIAELEQEVAALNGEIGALKEENAKFSDMRVQFEQGGFDKVVAGRDEEIRVLKARLTQESEDKAGWVRKAKLWQKRAVDLGWSSDLVIPLDQSDDEVIRLD